MPTPIYNNQIVAQGLARLTSAFRTQPNVRAWLAVLLQPFQDLEDAYWGARPAEYGDGILVARFLSTAQQFSVPPYNNIFDTLGALVGQPRVGLNDPQYVTAIRLRVAVNRSTGKSTDWSRIAQILLNAGAGGPVHYYDATPASQGAAFFLFVGQMSAADTPQPQVVQGIIGQACPNGVRGCFGYTIWTAGNDAIFSDATQPGVLPTGGGGFGDAVAGKVGGLAVSCVNLD